MECKRCKTSDHLHDGYCGRCGLIQPKPERPTHCWKCGHAVEIMENCPECGTLRGDHWEQEVEGRPGWIKKSPIDANSFRYYKRDYVKSFQVCDTCRVIMWHPLTYCMGCGSPMKRVKCTVEEMIRAYSGYRTGW